MREPGKIGYNNEWIKKVGKDKALKHYKEVYPDYDHSEAIDKVFPPKKEEKKDEK